MFLFIHVFLLPCVPLHSCSPFQSLVIPRVLSLCRGIIMRGGVGNCVEGMKLLLLPLFKVQLLWAKGRKILCAFYAQTVVYSKLVALGSGHQAWLLDFSWLRRSQTLWIIYMVNVCHRLLGFFSSFGFSRLAFLLVPVSMIAKTCLFSSDGHNRHHPWEGGRWRKAALHSFSAVSILHSSNFGPLELSMES